MMPHFSNCHQVINKHPQLWIN